MQEWIKRYLLAYVIWAATTIIICLFITNKWINKKVEEKTYNCFEEVNEKLDVLIRNENGTKK